MSIMNRRYRIVRIKPILSYSKVVIIRGWGAIQEAKKDYEKVILVLKILPLLITDFLYGESFLTSVRPLDQVWFQ